MPYIDHTCRAAYLPSLTAARARMQALGGTQRGYVPATVWNPQGSV